MMFRAIALGLSFLLCSGPALAAPEVAPSERVRRNVVVRAAPDGDAPAIGGLFPGDEALLIGDEPGWHKVRLENGLEGFVSKVWTIVRDTGLPAPAAAGELKLHMIDVGTGLALFIEGPGFTMLYDGGSQDDLATGPDNRIIAYIQSVRPGLGSIDHLVLSHPHKDHLELLPDIFDRFSIGHVWDSGAVNRTRGYCRFLKKVTAEPGVQYHDAIASGGTHDVIFTAKSCSGTVSVPQGPMMTGQPVLLGPSTSMTILHRDASRHHDPNENTLVVRLDHGPRRILIAGDAEGGGRAAPQSAPSPDSVEAKLLACCMAGLRSDVLVVGHHGSKTSSRTAFLDAVGASLFLISSGPHPYSRVVLPDAEVEEELERRGQLLQTDIDDDRCAGDEAKIGPDADESPGGCDNVIVTIAPDGTLGSAYNRSAD